MNEEEILKGKTLLVVDDEHDLRDIVASEFDFLGATVFQAENITSAQKILADNKIDLIVSDIRMPGGTGVDLLEIVKSKGVDAPPVILVTGFADITVENAFAKGAEALISKPFKLDDLIKVVIRYTSPFDARFEEEVSTEKLIKVSAEKIHFGRGGLSVSLPSDKKIEVGEQVRFEFEYNFSHFSGTGICRWIKFVDLSQMVGIEFLNLSNDSLNHFKQICDGKHVIPFIPSSNTLLS